ncbi:uncharacterized protein DUF4439 [Isoptericola jiangsuensis]|uniref:Uncharacterized protein DUF4439 n=1 Tax=Isoptericola jiangsuensis TaxID=548579 RepID=A0A2A9EUR3_9MICO|nr:DUF4439 domain-containing protein [Isoptericola jiangsuensis]PFG42774.1 uncharacterized protein DUF4439 [Isoptericola jiangsuensis]
MDPHRSPAPARRRRGAALGAVLLTLALAGCGLRLETPPPAEPVPDALEIVRRTAVSDALYVAEQAESAVVTLDGRRARLAAELERVADDSREQAAELGGEYASGLEVQAPVSGSPEPSAAPVEPGDVVTALVEASGRSRVAAGTTADGPLARLLASVGAAQAVSAARVGDLTDAGAPDPVDPSVPAPDASAEPTEPASADATDAAGALPSATTDEEEAAADEDADDVVSSTAPDSDEPAVLPRGLTAEDLRVLVGSEDSVGYALRVRAALRDGAARERLAARADEHSGRARSWALLAGTADTAQDPRQVAYAVPRGTKDKALVRDVEGDLGTTYASLVATTAAGTRGVLVDLLVESALVQDAWGADPVPFPGLPEQAGD